MSAEKKSTINLEEQFDSKGLDLKFSKDSQALASISIDDEDNTLFGGYEPDTFDEDTLNDISSSLLTNYGAKEFILIPSTAQMKDYLTPDQHALKYSFNRALYAFKADLKTGSATQVDHYKKFTQELDQNYRLVDLNFMLKVKSQKELYKELCNFLKDNANFTPGKMKEYAEGDIVGMKNRFDRKNVLPFLLIDNNNNIVATLRVLQWQNCAYVSDECVYGKILPEENFSSADEHRTFLMAYLVNRAFSQGLEQFDHFFLIGAEGRVHQYCNIGCKPFTGGENFDGSKLVISLSPSKLENIKTQRRALNIIKEETFSASALGASLSGITNQNTTQAPADPVQSVPEMQFK